MAMRRAAVVQYHTSADSAEHNRKLINDVLIELAARDPGGLDYEVFQFEDGVGFLHVAVFDGTTDPFADCGAHREFHRELQQRLAAPPIVSRAVLIGSYYGSRCCDA
jgi:hypothetical protein